MKIFGREIFGRKVRKVEQDEDEPQLATEEEINEIRLPQEREDIKSLLEGKLEDYQHRANRFKFQDPVKFAVNITDTRYKIIIAEALLNEGRVNRMAIAQLLSREDGDFDGRQFVNAWGVIERYVRRGF